MPRIWFLAGNDLNLGTVDTSSSNRITWDNDNWRMESGTAEAGSSILAKGDVTLVAGNDITARGAYVMSEQSAVNVFADNNVNLLSSENTQFVDEAHKYTGKGFLSKKTITTRDTLDASQAQGTVISGNTVAVYAGSDLDITGSHVVSEYGSSLYAGNDIRVAAAENAVFQNNFRQEKKSGVFSGGGFGITIGSQQQSNDNRTVSTSASASSIGSVQGDVNIVAGNHYTQTGSHVRAPAGDVNIEAQKVDIVEARNTSHTVNVYKTRQSGISVALSSPIISAIETAHQMYKAQEKTDDPRMIAMAGVTTGLVAKNAYDAVMSDPDYKGGFGIAISLGTSKSESTTVNSSDVGSGSTVYAGNNVNITASGAGTESDVTVRGSSIVAGNDVNLRADNDISLAAAADTNELHSKNSSSSASVGIKISVGGSQSGISFQAGLSKGRGNADGDDLVWSNTHVNAGNVLTLESGRDTNLIGAVAKGEQVVADVGGDLNIASLQDASTYDAQQKSGGISVSVCVPPLCYGLSSVGGGLSKSRVEGSYASVTEQSGIKAGDEGFQINVRGNTDLTGAVIASTDKAIEEGKNSLTTGSLTVQDISNHSDYKAKGYSLSGSLNFGVGDQSTAKTDADRRAALLAQNTSPIAGAGVAGEKGSQSSDTQSGISGGSIEITDESRQIELTGMDAETTIAYLNRDASSDRDSSNALSRDWDGESLL